MPNLPVLKSQTTSPVGPVVKETPATGIAEGIGTLGQGVASYASTVDDLVSKAVYGQEVDQAKLDYTRMREQYIANMRESPLIANVDDQGRLHPAEEGFGHMNELRTQDWETASQAFLAGQREKFSHGGAEQDFATWAEQQNETTRGEINQQTITEQLEYVGAIRTQQADDATNLGQFDLAREIIANGVEDGAFSIGTGREMLNVVAAEEEYQGYKTDYMDGYTNEETGESFAGYNSFEDPLKGLAATYDALDSGNIPTDIQAKLAADIEKRFTQQDSIDRQFASRAEKESWDKYTVAIEQGIPDYISMRDKIAEDETLSPGTKEHLWARMKATLSTEGKGTVAEQMRNPLAESVFRDRYRTNTSVNAELTRMVEYGEIPPEIGYYWMDKSRNEERMMNEYVYSGYNNIDDVFGGQIKQAEDKGDYDVATRLRSKQTAALEYFSSSIANAEGLISDDQINQFAENAMMMVFEDAILPVDSGPWREQKNIVDIVNFSPLEQVLYAVDNGAVDSLEGYDSVPAALTYAVEQSLAKMQAEYDKVLYDFQPVNAGETDFRIEATNRRTNERLSFRYVSKPNNKKKLELNVGRVNSDGSISWQPSNIQSNFDLDSTLASEALGEAFDDLQNPPDTLTAEQKLQNQMSTDRFINGIPETWIGLPMSAVEKNLHDNDITSVTTDDIVDAKAKAIAESFAEGRDTSTWLFKSQLKNRIRGVAIGDKSTYFPVMQSLVEQYMRNPPEDE